MLAPAPLRTVDKVLVATFVLFAFTSFVMEPYVVFGVDLAAARDPFGRAWHLYASRWDPLFLATPLFLRVMCGIDAVVFGPMYVALIVGFLRRREWVRTLALVYASAIVYSTIVYFAVELLAPPPGTDLAMVILINVPYTVMPLVLAWRVRRAPVF
jgi:hypothetical protein